jgi:Flp pilus assembly protein TadD
MNAGMEGPSYRRYKFNDGRCPQSVKKRRSLPLLTLFFPLAIFLMHCSSSTPTRPADGAIRHNNLGVALMDAGVKDPKFFPQAAAEFEAALQASPRYLTAKINLGMALYYSGQTERALLSLESAAREAPDNLYLNYLLGLLKEMAGKFQEARGHFQKVTQRDPEDFNSWYHLGYCYVKERQYQEAIEPFRKAAAMAPYQRRLRYNLYMALSRAGKTSEAELELDNFKKLEASNIRVIEAPKSTMEYLKQGKYAEAIPESLVAAAQPKPAALYTDVAHELGVRFKHAGTSHDPEIQKILQGESRSRAWFADAANQRRLIAALGSGVSFADYNLDGRLDIFLLNVNGESSLYAQKESGHFQDVTQEARLRDIPPLGMACAWGDYDNDGWPDLLVTGYGTIRLYRNIQGKFQNMAEPTGIAKVLNSSAWCMGAAFADVDHDGDLDIYVACLVDLSRLPEKANLRFPEDFSGQPNLLFRNNSNGTFTEIGKQARADAGPHKTRSVWFADVNDDRAVDFVLFDIKGQPTTMLNNKEGTFSFSNSALPNLPGPLPLGESRATGDFNGDGALDEILLKNGMDVVLNRNDHRPENWLSVCLQGYAVPGKVKSNKLGIGTKVEVRSVGMWERQELRAGNGTQGCDAPEVYFDLGNQSSVDFVRAVFPSGVRWTLKDVRSNQAIKIEEPLLDVNSCPTLFAWNGRKFEFIADTLSAGILGERVAPNRYWQPDSDEWLRIPSHQLQFDSSGILDLRFVNSLEEVTYLDHVRLLAIDHPASVEVYPSERMVNEPKNRQPIQLLAVKRFHPLAGAKDHHACDVTELLAQADRHYFDDFQLQPFKGFAESWSLTLELGPMTCFLKPVLLMESWSYWNSSAAIIAAAQANQTLWGPILEVRGRDGRWRTGTTDLGVSAGLPRTVVADLSPVLKAGENTVRIRSNRMLYYDRIQVAEYVERMDLDKPETGSKLMSVTTLPLSSAKLRWLGYPRRVLPGKCFPEIFDYSQIDQQSDWGTHAGMLTRYGEVKPLLRESDDQFVVMEHGEEVALSFDASRLPELRPGWKRTFLFYSDGFTKGYELYSGNSETVEPLPFHAMESYWLPGLAYPSDETHREYLLEWNTRPSFIRR